MLAVPTHQPTNPLIDLLHPAVLAATTVLAVVFSLVTGRRFRTTTLITIRLTIRILERGVLLLVAPLLIGGVNSLGRFCARASLPAFVSHIGRPP